MSREALLHLAKADPVMKRLIRQIEAPSFKPQRVQPYQALVEAVAYQQLHGKAAETILGRFRLMFPGGFPSPRKIDEASTHLLRRCGFSRAKAAAIKDIAAKTLDGTVPTLKRIDAMSDAEIIECLTAVRGVGLWTAEIQLMFNLGRPDVLPVGDYGIRTGFRIAYGMKSMPAVSTILRRGELWRPYRTFASWYLWRAADAAKEK